MDITLKLSLHHAQALRNYLNLDMDRIGMISDAPEEYILLADIDDMLENLNVKYDFYSEDMEKREYIKNDPKLSKVYEELFGDKEII